MAPDDVVSLGSPLLDALCNSFPFKSRSLHLLSFEQCIFMSPKLQQLSLSDNTFIGTIPPLPKSGATSPLTLLDLSGFIGEGDTALGGISGTIPTSIVGLSLLSYLDLSYNQLQGTDAAFSSVG